MSHKKTFKFQFKPLIDYTLGKSFNKQKINLRHWFRNQTWNELPQISIHPPNVSFMSFHIISCHRLFMAHVISCPFMSHAISCHMSFHVAYNFRSFHVAYHLCHVISWHFISYVVSCHMSFHVTYNFMSFHTKSHLMSHVF